MPATHSPQGKFKLEAKKKLIELGLTVTELGLQIGKSRVATSDAINNGSNAPTRKLIAEKLGIHLS